MPDGAEMKLWPAGKRLAALRAELDARLAALEGGADYADHQKHIRYLGGEIWELERAAKRQERP